MTDPEDVTAALVAAARQGAAGWDGHAHGWTIEPAGDELHVSFYGMEPEAVMQALLPLGGGSVKYDQAGNGLIIVLQ